MFARAVIATGGAAAIAAIAMLTPSLRRGIIRWLVPLEHIVRKLLLGEAGKLHRAARDAARVAAARGPRTVYIPMPNLGIAQHAPLHTMQREGATTIAAEPGRAPNAKRALDLTRPETWSARFSLSIPRDPLPCPESRAPRIRALWDDAPPRHSGASRSDASGTRAPARREHPALLLARRFEALRRVLDDPLPHARRLAEQLARIRYRFSEVVHCYAMAPARTNDYDPADPRLRIHAFAVAFEGEEAFRDTS